MAAFYKACGKRMVDIGLSALLLIVLSPAWLIAGVILFITNRGRLFFVQRRPGKDGRIFSILKFRTMNDKTDSSGTLLPDKDRLTAFGRFVRKSSLDEIPQLINVLWGQMSLVGPRPLLVEYLPLYNELQRRRHEVRPGITGWAQVNGRNALSWEEKFTFDVWYVDHLGFWLDLRVLALTMMKVFRPQGISSPTSATMEKFSGSVQ